MLVALAPVQGPTRANDSWRELFASLARLERLPRGTNEFDNLWTSLSTTATERERTGRKAQDAVAKYRARTILFHLQQLRGLPARAATEPDVAIDWLPGEAWFAARALVPGFHRVRAVVSAFEETPDVERDRAELAVRVSEDERLLLRLELAEMPVRALFARAPSAVNARRLSRVLVLRGTTDEALDTLTRSLDGTTDVDTRNALRVARARAASALGRERMALNDWGAALADGSDEAGLDLARRALRVGRRERALHLADLVLRGRTDREEALVAWGSALLLTPGADATIRPPGPGDAGSAETKTVR